MVLDAVSNFVRGTADAEVGASDTTVSVEDASIFPDPATDGEFNVVIWDVNNFPRPDQDVDVEIMRVTARDTTADELTVTRGQETTSAATHPEGSAIHLSPTAKMFGDIESTFGDFWDAGTQELTGDVNNTNTTTEALEAESVNTERITSDNITITKDTVNNISIHNGDLVEIAANGSPVIFDFDDPVDIVSGSIYGWSIDTLDVTWQDDTTDNINIGTARGKVRRATDQDDEFGSFPVPKFADVKKLAFTIDGVSTIWGWWVMTI